MDHFSREYLEKLMAEHRLVSAAYGNLTAVNQNRFLKTHGPSACSAAAGNLQAKRIELESMIEVLSEYLD